MKKIKLLSEVGFYSSLTIGIYSIYKTYIGNQDLPQGVCPVENYRWMMYLSVGLLISTLLIQEIIKRKELKNSTALENSDSYD